MQLITTSLPKPERIRVEDIPNVDVHGESRVVAYCEFCWGQDLLDNMVAYHGMMGNHVLAHGSCCENMGGVEPCTC